MTQAGNEQPHREHPAQWVEDALPEGVGGGHVGGGAGAVTGYWLARRNGQGEP